MCVPLLSLRKGRLEGTPATDVPSWREISWIWRTWEPDLQEHHHFSLDFGDWVPRKSRLVGPQSPVHQLRLIPVFSVPSLSTRTCSPAQICFPGSLTLQTVAKQPRGPGHLGCSLGFPACLHPSLAASFACKPSPVAFPASFLALGGHPGFALSPVQGWECGGKIATSREKK